MKLKNILSSLLVGIIATNAVASEVDPNGLWDWSIPVRKDVPERVFNLQLKADGKSLTGKLVIPSRTNDSFSEIKISNGKIDGDAVSFDVIRNATGDHPDITKYKGTLNGDRIEGEIEPPNYSAKIPAVPWHAKRNKTGKFLAGEKLKPGYDDSGNKIVNETHYKELSIADSEKFLSDHPDAIILDLRPPARYAAGHLHGAKNYDVSDFETYKEVLAPLDKSKWYLVHSIVGHFRTVRALEYFEANGFEHAAAIDGGYKAWVDAGKPVEK